jgi:hypothetical protein
LEDACEVIFGAGAEQQQAYEIKTSQASYF